MKLWVWRIVKKMSPGLNIHKNGLAEVEPLMEGGFLITTREGKTSAFPIPQNHWAEWQLVAGEKEAQEWVYDRR